MVSSSIRKFKSENLNLIATNRKEVDLLNQSEVNLFYKNINPEVVILSAGKVGGIFANKNNPAHFIYENLMIQSNVIHGAMKNKVKKLLLWDQVVFTQKIVLNPLKRITF